MNIPAGVFVLGLGSDLCNIDRIENSISRFGDRFINRVYTDIERAKADRRVMTRTATYAKRFAAKEALSKAIGTGMRYPVSLTHIGITHYDLGKPYFTFHPALSTLFTNKGIISHHLSISDELNLACAFVKI